jgi:formylglycine-generating enzyme required for sulfatase activity
MLLLLTFTVSLAAQALNVHTRDGAVTSFMLEEIQSISFSDSPADMIEWVTIPAGSYTYGPDGELLSDINYDFEIMKYEVTNTNYVEFLTEAVAIFDVLVTGTGVEGIYPGDDLLDEDQYTFYKFNQPGSRISWNGSEFEIQDGYALHPVTEVTWFGAWAFAQHFDYDLPTEQEWEKSARGDSGSDYPWGADTPTCTLVNFEGCFNTTRAIGAAEGESPYGLRDMSGNAAEWTASQETPTSVYRVIRGGGFQDDADGIRTWVQDSEIPSLYTLDIGFRCVRY